MVSWKQELSRTGPGRDVTGCLRNKRASVCTYLTGQYALHAWDHAATYDFHATVDGFVPYDTPRYFKYLKLLEVMISKSKGHLEIQAH